MMSNSYANVCCAMDIQAFVSNKGHVRIREFAFASDNALLHFQVDPQLRKQDPQASKTNWFVSRFVHGLNFTPVRSMHTHDTIVQKLRELYASSRRKGAKHVLIKNDQLRLLLEALRIPSVECQDDSLALTWVCSAHVPTAKSRCSLSKVLALAAFIQCPTPKPSASENHHVQRKQRQQRVGDGELYPAPTQW